MYHDSLEAFKQLISPAVSRISAKISHLRNGITHCVVQVSLMNGEEFMIEAYDEEADELYKEATEKAAVIAGT